MSILNLIKAENLEKIKTAAEEMEGRKSKILGKVKGKWGQEISINFLVEQFTKGIEDPTKYRDSFNVDDVFHEISKQEIDGMKVSQAITADDFRTIAENWCAAEGPWNGSVSIKNIGRGKFFGLEDALIDALTSGETEQEDLPEEPKSKK